MNDLEIKDNVNIEKLIYEIRGVQIIFDSDLAKLYNTNTGNLNRARNRNIIRFPTDFCFQITKSEYINLKCQNSISKMDGRVINRNLPYVYTEQGIAMLSSVLKTEVAAKTSIKIMRAFVAMKKYIVSNNHYQKITNIETKLIEHDNRIEEILNKLNANEKYNHIFFEGQIYDTYSLMMTILSKAKKEIIIIDNYAGRNLFDLLKNINTDIKIYSKSIDEVDYKKYKEQYSNIKIIHNDKFHDRFIIIDKNSLYHCGSSFKDLGKKCFAITMMEDEEILKNILKIL